MRTITVAFALTLVLATSAYPQTRTASPNRGYIVAPQSGFMPNPTPGYPPPHPYVFGSHSSPYVFNRPGYPNINSPSLRQQYYMYGNPTGGSR
jgi:hypothetical protein